MTTINLPEDVWNNIITYIPSPATLRNLLTVSKFTSSCTTRHYNSSPHLWASHSFDFRASPGNEHAEVQDSKDPEIFAHLKNLAFRTSEGLVLRGAKPRPAAPPQGYAEIDPFLLGGTFSIEVYLKYDSTKLGGGRIFDCRNSSSGGSDELSLFNSNNTGVIPRIRWNIMRDDDETFVCGDDTLFEDGVWTHIVLTASGEDCIIYKDGIQREVAEDGFEPNLCIRDKHIIGGYTFASGRGGGFMKGIIATFRTWQGKALNEVEVANLYKRRDEKDSFF
ncbi:hypothetical protein TrVE_jg9603 [Triparma verrucosa]|uniref:Uncharacterized protein n=1 Tax=Triparma verrucosa TaxID=1606542 RepID=A0A9W7FFH8_9STRA|nr:hypothetical protein TrVE_jg9603 [Triparma verrucosa]